MCPDPQLLSVYFDGELPSPWKEKMQGHLAQCPQCRQKLESYNRLSSGSRDTAVQAAAEALVQDRVWKKLEEKSIMDRPADTAPGNTVPLQFKNYHQTNFWKRRISISLPAAAAAAVLFIIAAAWLWTLLSNERQTMTNITVASEEYSLFPSAMDTGFDPAGMVQATNLNGVLQYLGTKDSGDTVILRLPETRSFFSTGEPAMIKAADYSRRKP